MYVTHLHLLSFTVTKSTALPKSVCNAFASERCFHGINQLDVVIVLRTNKSTSRNEYVKTIKFIHERV